MATLTSRLIISLVDQVSGPARRVKASLNGLVQSARTTPFRAMANEAKTMYRETRGAGLAAGAAIAGIVQQTKEFNEGEFGYQFARIPDHFKGVVLDMKGLQDETAGVADKVRGVAREFGLVPSEVMKARAEVEKIGISGDTGQSLWMAALGLNMADKKMPSDMAAKFLGSMYASFADQRKDLAARMGVDMTDQKQARWFEDWWLRSMAAKSAFAAAKSQLDPADLVSGARQFATIWADLGMTPEMTLGAIAHGSNFGFQAPELGTAFKSWGNRLVKPTAAGTRWMNNLGMDRSKWVDGFGAQDPAKAVNAINSLLGGAVYNGKGGAQFRAEIRALLDAAQKGGSTTSPEFQGALAQKIQKRLGSGWAGKADEVAEAVQNATMVSNGKANIVEFIREGLKKGMSKVAMLEILEGRHAARNQPLVKFFDAYVDMIAGLGKIDATHLAAVMEARRQSSAGKTTALAGAWEDLMITFDKSGVIAAIKDALLGLSAAIRSIPPETVQKITWALVGLASLGAAGMIGAGIVSGLVAIKAAAALALIPIIAITARLGALAAGIGRLALGATLMAPVGPAIMTASTAGAGLAASMVAAAAGIARVVMLAARLSVFSSIGAFIYQNWQGIGQLLSGIGEGFMSGLGPARPMVEGIASALGSILEWLWKLTGPLDESGAKWKSWGETIGSALAWPIKQLGRISELIASIGSWMRDSRIGNYLFGKSADRPMFNGDPYQSGAPHADGTTSAPPASVSPMSSSSGSGGASTGSPSSGGGSAQKIVVDVSQAMNQVRSIVAGVDLTAEGKRIGDTLANGLRQSVGAIRAAAGEAAAAAANGAMRGAYSDGGR